MSALPLKRPKAHRQCTSTSCAHRVNYKALAISALVSADKVCALPAALLAHLRRYHSRAAGGAVVARQEEDADTFSGPETEAVCGVVGEAKRG